MPGSRRLIKDREKYKTVLCANWATNHTCPYGSKCQFAHGKEELRARMTPVMAPSAPGEPSTSPTQQMCVQAHPSPPAAAQMPPLPPLTLPPSAPHMPTLKEKTDALASECGMRADLVRDLPIATVIEAVAIHLGLKANIDQIPTLPQKIDLLWTAASLLRQQQQQRQAAQYRALIQQQQHALQFGAAPMSPPLPPGVPTPLPPLPPSASPAPSAPPPPPPSPMHAPMHAAAPAAAAPVEAAAAPVAAPSRADELACLGMRVHAADATETVEDDDEFSPLSCNLRTGKVEASGRMGKGPPLPTRETSFSTAVVRRSLSFLFEGEDEDLIYQPPADDALLTPAAPAPAASAA